MSFFASFLAALIPMFLYLILIWRLDRHEREPFSKVLKHFLWGAFGAIFFGIIFSTLLNSTAEMFITREAIISFTGAVIIAPFVEELVKAAYLFRSFKKNYFDNLTDGLVYGGAIGLGFGMTENLLYFTAYDDSVAQWISIVITRSIFSAVMHAIATATVGAFLAKAKFTLDRSKYLYPIFGLSIAMFFHAAWNFSLSFEFTYYLGLLFMVFLIISFFMIFYYSLNNENSIIQRELKNEPTVFIDEQNASLFNLKKESKYFSSRSVRKQFVNFATKLAFRKLQSRNSEGIQKEKYLLDISTLRDKIKELKESEIS